MMVSVTTNKNLNIFLSVLWFLLQNKQPMTVPVCLQPKQQSRNQLLEIHCVYSPTYLMLKRELLSVVLELKIKTCIH